MARKKKEVAAAIKPVETSKSHPKITGTEEHEDGLKYFSQPDLSLYELAQYKLTAAVQAAHLKQHEVDEYQRKANQHLAQLQVQKKQLDLEVKKKKELLVELQKSISEAYEVDLTKVTYDDETGRITEPPPDAAESQPAA